MLAHNEFDNWHPRWTAFYNKTQAEFPKIILPSLENTLSTSLLEKINACFSVPVNDYPQIQDYEQDLNDLASRHKTVTESLIPLQQALKQEQAMDLELQVAASNSSSSSSASSTKSALILSAFSQHIQNAPKADKMDRIEENKCLFK